ISQGDFQNIAIRSGSNRESSLAVEQIKRSLLKAHLQFAALENTPILVAQDRQQNFIAKIRLQRLPVDIEIGGESRTWPIFEHIHSPFVKRLCNPDMIGYNIEYLSDRIPMQRHDPVVVLLACADRHI